MAIVLEWSGPNRWKTARLYTWFSKRLDRVIKIAEGFETDLASIPRPLLWLVDDDDIAESAVVHDHIYRNPAIYPNVTRKQADKVMGDILKKNGQSCWVRWVVYRGVRLGGRGAWKKWRG